MCNEENKTGTSEVTYREIKIRKSEVGDGNGEAS